eukprot:SM000001S04485  [mRNA]  locus=s1:469996:472250:- [translate_table: standard]
MRPPPPCWARGRTPSCSTSSPASVLPQGHLTRLREASAAAVAAKPWPSLRDEAWRFTDLRGLRAAAAMAAPADGAGGGSAATVVEAAVEEAALDDVAAARLVLVDGVLAPALSSLGGGPAGLAVGTLATLPPELAAAAAARLGSSADPSLPGLDVFTGLNGAAASDVAVVHAGLGVKAADRPVHVLYVSTSSGGRNAVNVSSPRLLVMAEAGAEIAIVEEFVGAAGGEGGSGGVYWTNAVAEFVLEPAASVAHAYLQEQGRDAFHIKGTFVTQVVTDSPPAWGCRGAAGIAIAGTLPLLVVTHAWAAVQAEGSHYSVVEAGVGGRLARHQLNIAQAGPDTLTELDAFFLAGRAQLHDLHSSLVLDHPRGRSRQLHKCIVADATGVGVFDGRVRVNRMAQQTDAGQLSRSLLLAPRATVNVKPNLQIVADDVKCTHGAAISDLEDDQLFYFRARGIDVQTARSALVFSFGAEVTDKLASERLRRRIQASVLALLTSEGAVDRKLAAGLGSGGSSGGIPPA